MTAEGAALWVGLAGFLGACYAVAGIGGWATARSLGTWYAGLRRPAIAPPNAVFGPVWTVLYALMAVAAWLVWREHGLAGAWGALVLFGAQLVLNLGWSLTFFGWRRPGWAVVVILALWGVLTATLVVFWLQVPLAGGLLVPYLAWVTFAMALNVEYWRLNRGSSEATRA